MNPLNIYAPKGTRVKFHGRSGENFFAYANEHLEDGKEYTVDYTVVHNWRTDVYLIEVPGRSFNSVVFEELSD